jgi:hypothetical protein
MAMCSYCLGEVADTATKCKHCGEWLHNNGDRTDDLLRDLSSTNPAVRQAERNVEATRLMSKTALFVCVAALVFLFVGGGEVDLMTTRVILVAAAVVGMVAGALLSSTSHIVELLVIIHRNQLRRENHLGQKLQKLQQALHE